MVLQYVLLGFVFFGLAMIVWEWVGIEDGYSEGGDDDGSDGGDGK